MEREILFKYVLKNINSGDSIVSSAYSLDQIEEMSFPCDVFSDMEKNHCSCNFDESKNHCDCEPKYAEYDIVHKLQYTGLKDKNGVKIFEGDVLEIKNYEYSERHCNGYYTRRTDLRFTIHQGLLETEYKLVSPPETLTHITLSVIFNLVNPKTGNRLYVDSLRQRIEVIGNIHEIKN